jgi:sugar transferase (PEP-CTERM/EpsH1 system associated)
MKKIRVVHILHSFGTGGMEKGVATIISHASNFFEHIVLCLSTSGETQRLLPPGTEVHELHKPPGNSLLFILKLVRALKQLAPDVVHTRNWGGTDGIIAARLAGIRSVIQGEHGWDMNDPSGLNRRRVKARKFLSSWVKEFTCVSKDMKKWLEKTIGVRRPITQIYNGIDIRVYYPANGYSQIRNELAIPDESFVIGTVGRLDPIKDHPTLFQAVEKARENHNNLRLLVVGDGPERIRLEKIAPESVYFLGNRTDIPDVLRALDLFVLNSLNEGISNTILEAMASGLPVVVTSVGGNPELVQNGKTGRLVSPGDSDDLASAMYAYIKNPDTCATHGKAGRIRAEKHFRIEQMVENYEAVYRRVADPDGVKSERRGSQEAGRLDEGG